MSAGITAEEIREIRKSYGLSQKSFATLLGLGVASLVRYEQGAEPSKANANLIRAARHPEFMAECLEREGAQLPRTQRESAEKIIYAVVSLEPGKEEIVKEATLDPMSAQYEFTLRWEVLNEQAANIIAEIISLEMGDEFTEPSSEVFEHIMDEIACLKASIVGTRDLERLSSIAGYLSCAQDALRRRNAEVAA